MPGGLTGVSRGAKKRIGRALRRRATELDLRATGLIEVAKWPGPFTQLQRLYLHSNKLRSLLEWLGQLTKPHRQDLGVGGSKQ